jgi:microcin C transport system substrate-binding protein
MRSFLILLVLLCSGPSWAGHAYAQFGDIKYAANFKNFDYVNPLAPKGGELVLVPPSRLSSFDKYNPFTLKGNAAPGLTGLVFESLLTGTMDEPTTAYGLLAEDVNVAQDRRSVTFRLRAQARFHNGDAVMAEDVKYSFEQLISKQAAPQFRTLFAEVAGVTVVDPRTLRFDFKRVNPELPLIVGGMPVFSRQWGLENGNPKPFDKIVTDIPIGG